MSLFGYQDPNDLGRYVKRCEMAFTLAGHSDADEIFKLTVASFTEASLQKLRELGLTVGEFSASELERVLNPGTAKTLEEELAEPQRAEESVQFYVKRLKRLLPLFGDEAPSPEAFLAVFTSGLHENLRETVRETVLQQVKRLPLRNLKETIEQLEETLKVIMDSTRDRSSLKPRNTCHACRQKKAQVFNLDELLDAAAEVSD